jgi:cation diffusion facilitator CzcD-associated flavoprotein CzcO
VLDLAFTTFKKTIAGKILRAGVQSSIKAYMQKTAPAEYHDILIPNFDFGAKRPVLDHGYLSVLHDPKIKLIRSHNLTVVGPRSVKSEKGEVFEADIIVLANGFETQQLLTPMKITGRNDIELPKVWQEGTNFASAYMGYVVRLKIVHPSHADAYLVFVWEVSLICSCSLDQIHFLQVIQLLQVSNAPLYTLYA